MARVSPLFIVPPVIFAAFAGLFVAGMQRENADELPSTFIGQPAPPVPLSQLGTLVPFDADHLRDGEIKLVNFWASWCAPCRVEHPHLTALQDEGIAIYGVNYKDDPDKALAFLAELGDPYAGVGADAAGRTAFEWGVYGVPETFVVDGDGTVLLRVAGPVTERALRDRLRPAMAAAQAD
jgi:cytochrome c biogenesis protein CcmG, thiol:disulfide interchange protein DsbE